MQLIAQRSWSRSWLLAALLLLIGGYVIWANIEQTVSARGGWIADFNDPRQLVGSAQAVFVGRVIEQSGVDETYTPFPQTQFQVEVVDTIKSVRKVNPEAFDSLPAEPAALPNTITVDQYGVHTRDEAGKRTLVLMNEQPLLVAGQTYLLVATYDPDANWYHVLPEGAMLLDNEDTKRLTVEKFKKAKKDEIPLTKAAINKGDDTPDGPPSTP